MHRFHRIVSRIYKQVWMICIYHLWARLWLVDLQLPPPPSTTLLTASSSLVREYWLFHKLLSARKGVSVVPLNSGRFKSLGLFFFLTEINEDAVNLLGDFRVISPGTIHVFTVLIAVEKGILRMNVQDWRKDFIRLCFPADGVVDSFVVEIHSISIVLYSGNTAVTWVRRLFNTKLDDAYDFNVNYS